MVSKTSLSDESKPDSLNQSMDSNSNKNLEDYPKLKWDVYSNELLENNTLSENSYNELEKIGMNPKWIDDFLDFQREKLFECVFEECCDKNNLSCSADEVFKHAIHLLDETQKKQLLHSLSSFRKDKMQQGVHFLLNLFKTIKDSSNQTHPNLDNNKQNEPDLNLNSNKDPIQNESSLEEIQSPESLGYQLLYQSKSDALPRFSEEEMVQQISNPLYRSDSKYRKRLQSILANTKYFMD